ncbi:MAG: heme NO-binding domain-containing protein [Arenibacterium sp.]
MHGLVIKSLEAFFRATYGEQRWLKVMENSAFEFSEFEALQTYDESGCLDVLELVSKDLGQSQGEVLEDVGTFLVSHSQCERLRRLLRFGGETYVEFLHSMDDLRDRARLAVEDLNLPPIELREHTSGLYSLTCMPGIPGFGSVLLGVLRAMADDYGALVMLDHRGRRDGCEVISIALIETAFAEGRSFDLGARTG